MTRIWLEFTNTHGPLPTCAVWGHRLSSSVPEPSRDIHSRCRGILPCCAGPAPTADTWAAQWVSGQIWKEKKSVFGKRAPGQSTAAATVHWSRVLITCAQLARGRVRPGVQTRPFILHLLTSHASSSLSSRCGWPPYPWLTSSWPLIVKPPPLLVHFSVSHSSTAQVSAMMPPTSHISSRRANIAAVSLCCACRQRTFTHLPFLSPGGATLSPFWGRYFQPGCHTHCPPRSHWASEPFSGEVVCPHEARPSASTPLHWELF